MAAALNDPVPPMAAMAAAISPTKSKQTSSDSSGEVNHPHILNKDKQIERLLDNSRRSDTEIVINNNDENVNIICNPGFYKFVVQPCLLSISPGHQINYKGLNFELRSSTPHKDQLGTVPSTVLKFIYIIEWNIVCQYLSIT